MNLSDENIQSLVFPKKSSKVTYTSELEKGLQLLIKRSRGSLRHEWHLRYTAPDERRTTLLLGYWPDMSETVVISAAKRNKGKLRRGIDPVASEKKRRISKSSKNFLQVLWLMKNIASQLCRWPGYYTVKKQSVLVQCENIVLV